MVPQWVKLYKYSLRSLSSAQFHGAALHTCPAEVSTSGSFLPTEREEGTTHSRVSVTFFDPVLKDVLVATLK